MKKIKISTFNILLVVLLLALSLSITNVVYAQNKDIVDQIAEGVGGVNLPTAGSDATQVDLETNRIVGGVINAFLGIFGVLFLALMVYGGFKWMIAQGREEEVQKAKTIIQAAIIGFGIAVSAYAIARFVTMAFFSAAGG